MHIAHAEAALDERRHASRHADVGIDQPRVSRIVVMNRELYVDYLTAVGTSKVAPGIIERKLIEPATSRNWNTVVKLIELAKLIEN